MKKRIFIKIYATIFLCLAFAAAGHSQIHKSKEEAEKNAGKGVTFKIPDKFMTAPLNGFKGMMMLNRDAPAGIFVSYPNEGESIGDLTKRVLNAIPKLFGGAKDKEHVWTTKSVDSNEGDKAGTGTLNQTANADGTSSMQVALFEREWNGLTFVYGYFAMKSDKSKNKDLNKYWLDEKGKGVKPLEKFVKTFPANRAF